MFISFEVSNHRSILDKVELSMVAVDKNRVGTRPFVTLKEELLTVAGIYGPNASGKSNLLDAISWVSNAVRQSVRGWDDLIPRDPFKFDPGPGLSSTYVVKMVVDGVRYDYSLELDQTEVIFESLYGYPERRKRILFERNRQDIRLRRGKSLSLGIRELATPTTLVLSAAMRLKEPEIERIARAISKIDFLGDYRNPYSTSFRQNALSVIPTIRIFDDDGPLILQDTGGDEGEKLNQGLKETALELLRVADFGIEDVELKKEKHETIESGRFLPRSLQLTHKGQAQTLPFDFSDESSGTQLWFKLIGPILNVLRTGRTLLLDELGLSLHPQLTYHLIEIFQDIETNPLGAQLIFTSHDTNILGYLNRDEVWLTEKNESGSTSLIALAEYGGEKVRQSANIERAYLQGRFGAVPEISSYDFRRVLSEKKVDD